MKKSIFAFAALAAAISLVSCNKEQIETDKSNDLKVNINVSEIPSAATKAAKTGWEAGDKINIWFYESESVNPEAVVVYDGSAWALASPISSEVKTRIKGYTGDQEMTFLYESRNDLSQYIIGSYNPSQKEFSIGFTGTTYKNNPFVCSGTAVSWSTAVTDNGFNYHEGTLTLNMKNWDINTDVQIVVEGLDAADAAKYYLDIDHPASPTLTSLREVCVVLGNWGDYWVNGNESGSAKSQGMANADGVAFYYALVNGDYTGDLTFTLYNTSGVQQGTPYAVAGKTLKSMTGHINSIKIKKSKFGL